MGDYIEEINTALATRGEDYYLRSIEDVQTLLERESQDYKDQAITYATLATGISGSGVAGRLMPEFYSQTAEQMDLLSQNDLATIGLVSALGVSMVPLYLAKKNKDKMKEVNQVIDDLEQGNYDEDSPEFAYKVADNL